MANSTELEKLVDAKLPAADRRIRTPGNEWVGIIIHHTGLPNAIPRDEASWKKYQASIAGWLTKKDDAYLSAHFQIGRFGEVIELVDPDTHESFHAGVSAFWHPRKRDWVSDWNRHAIGIELLGDGNVEPFSEAQYQALAGLCRALLERYPTIMPTAIVGHEMVAPGRKSDPGRLFEWRRLFALIFGA